MDAVDQNADGKYGDFGEDGEDGVDDESLIGEGELAKPVKAGQGHMAVWAVFKSSCVRSLKKTASAKIQRHFYRAHACFVEYFLMTKKLQQIKKLAYVTTCGPRGPLLLPY